MTNAQLPIEEQLGPARTAGGSLTGSRGLLLFLVLISAYLLQCLFSMRLMSASSDETDHLPAGYSYWKTGTIDLNIEHPPLIKLLAALPLLAVNPTIDLSHPYYSGTTRNDFKFGAHFLNSNDADLLLLLGRIPNVLLGLLLAIYIWRWAAELFGKRAGFFALFLYVTCPNIIAHARLVTMDIGLSCFSTIIFYHWWRYHKNPSDRRQLLYVGVVLGFALATKFTALLLIPSLGLLSLAYFRQEAAANPARQTDLLFHSMLITLGVCMMGAVLVWVFYFCPRDLKFYLEGMKAVHAVRGYAREFFMLGMVKDGGWYSYFLVAFLLKSQIPFLLALLLCALYFRKIKMPVREELFLLLPALIITLVISLRAANLGLRYLLPIYPLLFIFVSRLANYFTLNRNTKIAVIFLAIWQLASLSRAWPDYIGYFNEFIGAPVNGPNYLEDSNLDWGQNLILLKKYMEKNKISKVTLDYWGTGSPDYYKIPHQVMKEEDYVNAAPGIYVISTNYIANKRVRLANSGINSFVHNKPQDRIGMGLFVYYIGIGNKVHHMD